MAFFYPGMMLLASTPFWLRLAYFVLPSAIAILLIFNTMLANQLYSVAMILLLLYFALASLFLAKQRLARLNEQLASLAPFSTLPLSNNDQDFNQLAVHINHLLRELKRKQQLLEGCAKEAQYTADELNHSSVQLADDAEQEHAALDSIATTAEEMTATVNEIAGKISLTEQMAQNTSSVVNSGKHSLQQLQTTIDQLKNSAEKNQQHVQTLTQYSADISHFVSTISKITANINLLALNAAIEAARAGDAGRGFSVVASEVRVLSSDTEKAAQDIADIVEKIHQQVQVSSQDSTEMLSISQNSVASIDHTEQQLNDIDLAATTTCKEVNACLSLISEFSKANEEMCQRLQEASQVSEKNSLSSKDTKDMVKYLYWLSAKLQQQESES